MTAIPELKASEVEAALRNSKVERFGTLPTATGGIARSACLRTREAGIELAPLLKKAGLARDQIENSRISLAVRSQINLLNFVADALDDDLLGFHLAQPF